VATHLQLLRRLLQKSSKLRSIWSLALGQAILDETNLLVEQLLHRERSHTRKHGILRRY
jgi:hypothetical protein